MNLNLRDSWENKKPRKKLFNVLSRLGGGRWIRTTEGIASRFTVCPLWPLGNSPILNCTLGAGGRTRTPDLLITNQLLYQLSYTSVLSVSLRDSEELPILERLVIIAEPPCFVKNFFIRILWPCTRFKSFSQALAIIAVLSLFVKDYSQSIPPLKQAAVYRADRRPSPGRIFPCPAFCAWPGSGLSRTAFIRHSLSVSFSPSRRDVMQTFRFCIFVVLNDKKRPLYLLPYISIRRFGIFLLTTLLSVRYHL